MVDTGSPLSILPTSFLDEASLTRDGVRDVKLKTVSGSPVHVVGKCHQSLAFQSACNKSIVLNHEFIVADFTTGPILGSDFLQKFNIDVNFCYGLFSLGSDYVPFHYSSSNGRSVVLTHDVFFRTIVMKSLQWVGYCVIGKGKGKGKGILVLRRSTNGHFYPILCSRRCIEYTLPSCQAMSTLYRG